ncbi:hypothetical protein VPH35_093100 [Triticum aestivum]
MRNTEKAQVRVPEKLCVFVFFLSIVYYVRSVGVSTAYSHVCIHRSPGPCQHLVFRAMVIEGSRTPSPGRRRVSASPVVRRGRSPTWRGCREVVVQQEVVHQASSTVIYPALTATNYFEWSLIMKVNMEAQRVWDAIKGGGSFSQDRAALAAILRAVPEEMHSTLAMKATAKEAWDAIKIMRVGDARVPEAKAQTLLKEFDAVRMRSGATLDELAMRMNGVTNKLRTLG